MRETGRVARRVGGKELGFGVVQMTDEVRRREMAVKEYGTLDYNLML